MNHPASLPLRSMVTAALIPLLLAAAGSTSHVTAQDSPRTRPERTGYEETSRYADVISFIDSLRLVDPELDVRRLGYSEQGRLLPLLVFGAMPGASAEEIRADPRLRVLVLANIHAGEVAGKEAALVLARALAYGRRADWLDSVIVLVAPIYNADGNERIDLRNRPDQYGPLAGMGERQNALGLDLNRDNMKLDAPESRALSRAMQEFDPDVLVDLHTTNGTKHAYYLTYAPPLHPDTDPEIVAELRERWLPSVTSAVYERSGWHFFHYGNIPGTWGMKGEQGWYTFDHRPRFTTNYVGLRNRFGILSEAYSYASFEERIRAHGLFVESLLDYASVNATRLREIVNRADSRPATGTRIALTAELQRGDTVTILMGAVRVERNPYSGKRMLVREDVVTPERMPDYTEFRSTLAATVPAAYLVPATEGETIERIRAHGIQMRPLGTEANLEVGVFKADSVRTSEREYQGRYPTVLFGSFSTVALQLPPETIVVPTAQPLGRLAALLLEPRSDDGLAAWGILGVDEQQVYPVFRADRVPDGS